MIHEYPCRLNMNMDVATDINCYNLDESLKENQLAEDTMHLSTDEHHSFMEKSNSQKFNSTHLNDKTIDDSIHNAVTQSKHPIHAEVCVCPLNCQSFSTVETHVVEFLRSLGPRHVPTLLNRSDNDFNIISSSGGIERVYETLNRSVYSINLVLDEADEVRGDDAGRSVDLRTVPLLIHVYQLINGEESLPVQETITFGSESINVGTTWLLPSAEMSGLWESLVFDSDVKTNLLQYAQTALLFADHEVSSSIISWNRVILLYGPPGTGKTSICRALANKLAIRMSNRYSSTQLIEINTMNLMSRWFSESARLVSRMFQSIKEYLQASDHLVCLLIDEVESITAMRSSSMSGCEPSDAIRVVNSVLTEIDQIKRFPNVIILATSNVTGVIDPAFLDRADIRLFIGPPSAPAIYTIYRSCLNELLRVHLINSSGDHNPNDLVNSIISDRLISYQSLAATQFSENKDSALSLSLWRLAEKSVGLNGRTLRKLPLIAYAFYLSKIDPLAHCNSYSLNSRVHLANNKPAALKQSQSTNMNNNSSSVSNLNQESTMLEPDKVSLSCFIEALHMSIDAQFEQTKALDAASHLKTRLLQ